MYVPVAARFFKFVDRLRTDAAYQIQALHVRGRARSVDQGIGSFDADGAVLRAVIAQVPRELARVNFGDADDAVPSEVSVERFLRTVVGYDRAFFANDEACDLRLVVHALGIVVIDARVANLWRGHGHDLTRVGRVSEHFLIAGHAGREHDFTDRSGIGSECSAWKYRAVGEGEVGATGAHRAPPSASKAI